MSDNRLLLTFYGDDFTGSTDVMEQLCLGGVRTVLFLEPPKPEQLTGRFAGLGAVGVAGISRSMTPAQMKEALPPVFRQLKALNAEAFHYKICSTFDSSPEIGSIGCAIDLGQEIFDSSFIPLLVGAPMLNRFSLFGNLFARVNDVTYRLDRHPTMSCHPVTPMDESDLRLHLGKQTNKSIELFDIFHLEGTQEQVDECFRALLNSGPDIILFDVLDEERLTEVGRLIWSQRGEKPLFMVGSSGIEFALRMYWHRVRIVPPYVAPTSAGEVEQLVVVSGSCAPATAGQIEWAVENGFAEIALDTPELADPDQAASARSAAVQKAIQILSTGKSLVIHSAKGPDDPRIESTRQRMISGGIDPRSTGERLGEQLGIMLREVLEATGLRRAMVTGGDTSGHATRQLGIYALEFVVPVAPGAPLCSACSHTPGFDGLQISLKGGQNGKPDYFGCILKGEALS